MYQIIAWERKTYTGKALGSQRVNLEFYDKKAPEKTGARANSS